MYIICIDHLSKISCKDCLYIHICSIHHYPDEMRRWINLMMINRYSLMISTNDYMLKSMYTYVYIYIYSYLVGGFIQFLFSIIYGMSSFPVTSICFKMVIAPPTSYTYRYTYIYICNVDMILHVFRFLIMFLLLAHQSKISRNINII